jgi:phosphohistidine phosphatase
MSLTLDLLRHGEALPRHPAGDTERILSSAGERSLATLGGRLAAEGWRPGRVFASPYRRARDSARIVTRAALGELNPEILPELVPFTDPDEVLSALANAGVHEGHVLLVGHLPLLGRLTERLAGSPRDFSPGSLVRISCPDGLEVGTGTVVSAIQPDHDE